MEPYYNPQAIEAKARADWQQQNAFSAQENASKEKFYCLAMFPYPSGKLHMGHVRNYTLGDVIARYQRMLGKNVLQPMGWDAFGLPAENAAIQHKVLPATWTRQNISQMRIQMQQLGLAYDWQREIATCDPHYYHWEQWFFIKLYEKGLVYQKKAEVNWDPVDQTILANEQVIDGRGWRSGALVERREIPQWFLKITAYADELLRDLDDLKGWPEQVKTMQRNWIGRSEGVEIQFTIPSLNQALTIFTTRPDTLFGVTYLAIAPQHPLAKQLGETNPTIRQFLSECRNIKVAEAELATIEKKGIATDINALHPFTGQPLPIWIANFVVMDYGTGALMAVPAHDQRDYEFAKRYGLTIQQVIAPNNGKPCELSMAAFTQSGRLIHSGEFTGLTSSDACQAIIEKIEAKQVGRRIICYRLRDWSISRQRYWGTPIPMIYCDSCGIVPEQNLPVVLPEHIKFSGVASPLKTMPEFYQTTCPRCHESAHRETDTFDTFFESSWYYARFSCPDQQQTMLDKKVDYWLPVDQYIGGIEHAVMHLLYARFIHKLLRDQGLLKSDEPFIRLLTQGMVLNQGIKMSKSKGNTVDPQILIERYGADTVRLFTMFAAPPEQNLEWSDSGVEGSFRFLKKLWHFAYQQQALIQMENQQLKNIPWDKVSHPQRNSKRELDEILDQARYDYERLQFNTVVSGCMKLFNLLNRIPEAEPNTHDSRASLIQEGLSILLRLLAPIAPHITHHLWQTLGYEGNLLDANWPKTNSILKIDTLELGVQVNGKLRSRIKVPADANEDVIRNIASQDPKVGHSIAGQTVKKVIVVPGKLINIVVG